MKRKIWTAWMVCLLVCCMVFPAHAAQDLADGTAPAGAEAPFAGYVLKDRLYAFFEAGETGDVSGQEVLLSVGGRIQPEQGIAKPLAGSGQYVHYYILLDASGSVRRYKDRISAFVMKLIRETEADWMVTVMTLGESFHEVISGSVDDDAVKIALDDVSYTEQRTNLYKGIQSAVRFMDEKEKTRGDLYRLILVTDGNPDGESESPSPEEVKEQVEARTDIVFDVVSVGRWEEGSEKNLPMSGREVNTIGEDAAMKLAGETNSLYTVNFGLSLPDTESTVGIKLLLRGSNRIFQHQELTIVGRTRKQNDSAASQEEAESGEDKSGGQEPVESESGENQSAESVTEENTTGENTSAENETEENASAENKTDENTTGENASEENVSDKKESPKDKFNLLVYGALLAAGIILGVIVVLLLRKLFRRGGEPARNRLRIEVLLGQYGSRKKDFPLDRTLIIGSDKKCDMVWNEPDVSGQNTRIFMHEGAAYIEDLNSPCGTVIGGMRIYAPNRLRSGDIISIGGRTQFRVFF